MSLVSYERADRIGIVKLDRPEAMNALSGALADELTATFEKVAADDGIWAVVLGATGDRAFCVGADLKERAGFSLEDFHRNRAQIRGVFAALRAVPQPVVAGVFGFALGGGFELALSCDLIVAAEGTQLGLPEVRLGLLPAGGGTQLLPRKVGLARAKDLILRGRRIDAREALDMGLLSAVVGRDEVDATALDIAREICSASPVAVKQAKRSLDAALGLPIDEGIDAEHEAWSVVITSDDRREGIAAFTEKRDPNWTNR